MHPRRFPLTLILAVALGACSGGPTSAPATQASPTASLAPATAGIGSPAAPLPSGLTAVVTDSIVIDTDMAPDDWMAILFLLARPELHVLAITVTGAGEAHCEPGVANARKLAAFAGQPGIPVACGRDTPIAGDHAFPDEWRPGVDALLGLSLPANTSPSTQGSAVDLLKATLSSSTEPVTILTLGPLTNIADLIRGTPDAANRISSVIAMGGAVDVGGNVFLPERPSVVAEWNFYVDPTAASIVIDSSVPFVLVPLDATNEVPITRRFAERLAASAASSSARFISSVLTARAEFVNAGTLSFWDPLAAAVLVAGNSLGYETRSIHVVTDEGPDSGRTVGSPGEDTWIAVRPDAVRFEDLFISSLNAAGN